MRTHNFIQHLGKTIKPIDHLLLLLSSYLNHIYKKNLKKLVIVQYLQGKATVMPIHEGMFNFNSHKGNGMLHLLRAHASISYRSSRVSKITCRSSITDGYASLTSTTGRPSGNFLIRESNWSFPFRSCLDWIRLKKEIISVHRSPSNLVIMNLCNKNTKGTTNLHAHCILFSSRM